MESGLPQAKCGYCKSASQDMKSCSKCHLTQYCSKQCQRQDWQRHKKWCEILQGNPAFQQEESQDDPQGGQRAEMSRDQTPLPGESSAYVQEEVEVRGNPDQDSNGSSNSNSQTAGKKKRRKKKQGNGRVSPELSKCSWCSKTSAKALGCSRCKSRSYCSDVCQRKDWIGGHQKTCQSIKQMSESPRLTKEDDRQGLSEDSDAKVCDWCQKYLDSPLRCTGCGKVKYCSEACQKKDWGRQHKNNCDRKLPKKTKEPREPENTDSEVFGDSKKIVNCEIDDVEIEDDQIDACDWCQKYLDAPLKCSGCRKARYCTEECQKKDWTRQHKDNCDKTFLSKKGAKARKATKSATPELDRAEEPPMTCNWCQKYVEDPFPCDGCSRVIYCSIECKNKDWLREHQTLCDGKENKKNARSRPSNEIVEDAEGGKDSCKCCKKRTRDTKKCARCKIVIYCSKSCQRQDWPRHKKDCITVDGVIKTKEFQKAEQEAEAEARRRDVPMSPLEAMAHLMGMSGAPQRNVEPCMMWMKARELAKAKFPGFKLIENFDDLPGEFLWMVPQTSNEVLLAYISSRHHHFARHAVYIRDGFRHETSVMFYLDYDNPLPFFSWSKVAPGNYICIRNAIFHNFMDGSVGIRVNEAADVRIIS